MRSFWSLVLAACLTWLVSSASAQDAPSPVIVPPSLDRFVEAERPQGTESVAGTVFLLLSIDAEGRVTDAMVEVPVGHGFDEAALVAARQLTFKPASRDGVPVPTRIRFQYAFEFAAPSEPPPPLTGQLAGLVTDRVTNQPLAGADVSVLSSDGAVRTVVTNAEGHFELAELAAGTYTLRIASLEHQVSEGTETVVAGERIDGIYRLVPESEHAAQAFGAVARVEAPAREIVRRTIPREELTRMAGTRGDPLRAIELLPGVARPPAGLGMVLVRGSAPGDSEVFLDGAPIYLLYHFGGLTSVANGRLLTGIDLYPGNFSARYGRKTGGVIETGLRDPARDGLHGVLDVNMIDASLLVETPISKNVSVALAARRSYLDTWFKKAMESADTAVVAAPTYYDYQAIVAWQASSKDKLRLLGFGSYDELTFLMNQASERDPSMRGRMGGINSFHRAQLEWRHEGESRVNGDVMLAAGPLFARQAMGPDLAFEAQGYDVISRAELRIRMLSALSLNLGFDGQLQRAKVRYRGPAFQQSEGNPSQLAPLAGKDLENTSSWRTYGRPALYGELVAHVTDQLELTAGARLDYFSEIDAFSVDPRLNARLVLGSTTLRSGVGLFSQPPQAMESVPGVGNPDLDPVRALHVGAGVEQRIAKRATVSLDGFYKKLSKLIVNGDDGVLENRGIGRIYGLELMGRMEPIGRFSGFLAYTLSRSERNDRDGEGWRLFDYDQTHVLSVAGNLSLGRGWLFGSTFRLASGNPNTPVASAVYDANLDLYQPLYGRTNSARNDTFHRLDVRIEKKWNLGSGSLTAYLDVQNAYNRQNPEGTLYNFDYSQRKSLPGLPIIPSLGLRGEL